MSYPAAILADSPLLYWRLGESSGTVAADTSGNGQTGTYHNSPTLGTTGLQTSDANTAVTVAGASAQSVRGDNTTFFPSGALGAFSVELLIRPSTAGLTTYRTGMLAGSDDRSIGLLLFDDSGTIRADFLVVNGEVLGTTPITASTIFHFVGTWDGTTAKVYVNGVLEGTQVAGSQSLGGAVAFWVGDESDNDPWDGVVDEAAVYGSALSAARVLAHYNAMSSSSNFTFTPPTENTVSNVAYDVPPIWNRLMRFYPTRKRGKAVWKLPNGTFTFDQPYPSTEDTLVNRDSLFPAVPTPPSGLGTSTSNLIAVSYEYVYLGGHTYVVDATEEALLATFLTAQGYTPSDWLVPA